MNSRASFKCNTPIAFFVFNRPELTKRVFNEIRKSKPRKLLVVADGPRANRIDENEKVVKVKEVIEKGVDWDCDVITNYSDENLGCKNRVSSGINWVFDTVEEAIILEDDCLPCQSFFRFCQELLDKYRYDERVSIVSGDNFGFGYRRTQYSYYFSKYTHIWGWASWRRCWRHYDVDMKIWPSIRDDGRLSNIFPDQREQRYWERIFESVYRGQIDTWDFQWVFCNFILGKLSVMPSVNLISNLGFSDNATHTKKGGRYANMQAQDIDFPMKHPPSVKCDIQLEQFSRRMFLPLFGDRVKRFSVRTGWKIISTVKTVLNRTVKAVLHR